MNSTTKKPAYLYWPNIVDYIRILLFAVFLINAFRAPAIALICFIILALCDVLDGYLARKFNQQSHLGTALDFMIDRVATAALLLILACKFPGAWLLFCSLMIIDLSSHFMHLYKTSILGGGNHKHAYASHNRILDLYYNNRAVLFILCFCHDAWLISLFWYAFAPSHWLIVPLVLFAPGLIAKTLIHLLQFYRACVELLSTT